MAEPMQILRTRMERLLAGLDPDSGPGEQVPWALQEWRRVSIPVWRDVLNESIARGDREEEVSARWMLEVLQDQGYGGSGH